MAQITVIRQTRADDRRPDGLLEARPSVRKQGRKLGAATKYSSTYNSIVLTRYTHTIPYCVVLLYGTYGMVCFALDGPQQVGNGIWWALSSSTMVCRMSAVTFRSRIIFFFFFLTRRCLTPSRSPFFLSSIRRSVVARHGSHPVPSSR